MQWFATVAVSTLCCVSLFEINAQQVRQKAVPGLHQFTAQWFCGDVLRHQLTKRKRGQGWKRNGSTLKLWLCGEHRLLAQQQVYTDTIPACLCASASDLVVCPGCTAGLDALRHPSAPWD